MTLTPEDVARLARLARIDLTQEELERLAPQLDVIMASNALVSQVASADVPPTSHPLPMTNVFRPDVVTESLPVADALRMAPASQDDRFKVPRILEADA